MRPVNCDYLLATTIGDAVFTFAFCFALGFGELQLGERAVTTSAMKINMQVFIPRNLAW